MDKGQLLMLFAGGMQILFAFLFGSCIGSLINVLVYRMPRGLSVVSPPSRCPKCDHLLSWRENIPVFGWIFLRGKCRFCKNPISPEYPIVEAIVGLAFVLFYMLWYIVPEHGAVLAGVDWSTIRPEWALNGWSRTWPIFVMLMVLVGALIAMTIIDARTFMIPLALAWTPTVVAFVAHPAWAFALSKMNKTWAYHAAGHWWALPTPGSSGWPILLASFGAVLGLLIANALVMLGLIRRSFVDYDQWEAQAMKDAGIELPDEKEDDEKLPASQAQEAQTEAPGPSAWRWKIMLVTAGFVLVGIILGRMSALRAGLPPLLGMVGGLLVAVPAAGPICRKLVPKADPLAEDSQGTDSPAEFWIQYPHARWEILYEVLFLLPVIALGLLGWQIGQKVGGPWTVDPTTLELIASRSIPLWLSVLGGVCLGYIVGGGLIWGIRILGTLGFGKEAMGLGDVHLLAAVGACLGWIDAVSAFFLAPFMALYIVLVQTTWTGSGKRAMPYGPYLAVATFVVLLAKPGIEALIAHLFGAATPMNFP